MRTHETLVDLLVGVVNAAEAGTAKAEVTAAVAKAEDKVLVCPSQLHVGFQILRQEFPWVLRRQVGNIIKINAVIVAWAHSRLLIVASHNSIIFNEQTSMTS